MRPLEVWAWSDVPIIIATLAAIFLPVWAFQAAARARSRRGHADAPITGAGSWEARFPVDGVEAFFDAKVGFIKAQFLSNGIPMRLDLTPSGMTATLTCRLLPSTPAPTWTAPWGDVVRAIEEPAGHATLGSALSTVALTDILITVVGPSAERFLEVLDLGVDEDEDWTPEEEAEVAAMVQDIMDPHWTPGTALFCLRTSAPDGLVEAITRQARGVLPT